MCPFGTKPVPSAAASQFWLSRLQQSWLSFSSKTAATGSPTILPSRQVIHLGVEGNPRLLGMLCSSRLCFQATHQLIQVSFCGRISPGPDCKIFRRNWAKSYSNKNSYTIRAIVLLVTSVNQFRVANISSQMYTYSFLISLVIKMKLKEVNFVH